MNTSRIQALALGLLDWHGGQSSPLYAVGSALYAGQPPTSISRKIVNAALRELRACHDAPDTVFQQLSHRDRSQLRKLARELKSLYQSN